MAGEISPHWHSPSLLSSETKEDALYRRDMLLRMLSAINNGFARDHGHINAAIRCAWLSMLIGFFAMLRKDKSLQGKPVRSIFTTAYFVVSSMYSSHKRKLFGYVADLERPTNFVNVHTLSHCNTPEANCARYWRTMHTWLISPLILSYNQLSCMTVGVQRCHIHSW